PDEPMLTQPPPKYHGGIKAVVDDLRLRVKRDESVVFVVPTTGKVDRLREILKDYEIPFDRISEGSVYRPDKDRPASQPPADSTVRSPDTHGVFIAPGEIR